MYNATCYMLHVYVYVYLCAYIFKVLSFHKSNFAYISYHKDLYIFCKILGFQPQFRRLRYMYEVLLILCALISGASTCTTIVPVFS